MVLTREDLINIKEAIGVDSISKSIVTLTETVNSRIDNLETKLVTDLQKINHSIKELEKSNVHQAKDIVDNAVKINESIKSLATHTKEILSNSNKIEKVDKMSTANTLEIHAQKVKFDTEVQKIAGDKHTLDETNTGQDNKIVDNKDNIDWMMNRIEMMERALYSGLQHSRKFNVEIDGIPTCIGDIDQKKEVKKLEVAAVKIFNAVGVLVTSDDIDAIHRLPTKFGIKPTIVRLKSRKTQALIMENKHKLKNLKDLNIDIAGLHDDSSIYVKASLCPYYKSLAYNCRLLKKNNLVAGVEVTDEGIVKLNIGEARNPRYIKIKHESELQDRFENFDKFSF